MARGFESKDVAFQQAEVERRKARGPALSPEEREAETKRRTLQLALSLAETELASARSAAHRQMLERAMAALREQLLPRR